MLQLEQNTSLVLPSAARAGQSKTTQSPPPRSLVHRPAASTSCCALVFRPTRPRCSQMVPPASLSFTSSAPESPTSRSQDLL